MELFDLYTADRVKTDRTMVRGEQTPEGYYRLVVHVCIFNSEGQMLIQKRQPFKRGWSNLWDITVGGSAISGDSSRSAAERETLEELGISINLTNVRPTMTIYWEYGFDDYYVLTQDVDPDSLHLQYDGRFIPYEKSQIELLFFRRNHRSSHTRSDPTND